MADLGFAFSPALVPDKPERPTFDRDAVAAHIGMLHTLATAADVPGVLVLAGFGEDPISGRKERPRVERFAIGAVADMVDAVMAWEHILHLNAYAPWAVFRKDLEPGRKGEEADVRAVLALVIDQDNDKGETSPAPIEAPYLIETSEGNFQPIIPLARALSPAEAKPIALALGASVGGDAGTKDLSHVWRIPGTLNWPNAKKLARGRAREPQLVRVASRWAGDLVEAAEVVAAVAPWTEQDRARKPLSPGPAGGETAPATALFERCSATLKKLIAAPPYPGEDRSAADFGTIRAMMRAGFTDDEITALVLAHPQGVGMRYVSEGKDLPAEIRRAHEKDGDALSAEDFAVGKGTAEALARSGTPTRALFSMTADQFDGKPVPPRQWHVPEMIPTDTVTMLGGDGGTGKSLLALQLAAATAVGRRWLDRDTAHGRSLVLSAEDDIDELHRRLADIAAGYRMPLADFASLRLVPLAGEDAVLAAPPGGKHNVIAATPLWRQLESLVSDWKPALVVLDTLADLFAGEENSRAQARQFIGLLRGLAIKQHTSILLLSHPSLTGISSGTGLSGSTGWNNSVRSRLYLSRAVAEDGIEPDSDLRIVTTKKANYSPTGVEIRVRWAEGMFRPEGDEVSTGKGFADAVIVARADRVFLELVVQYTAEKRGVSPLPSANYAPAVFARDPKSKGLNRSALALAMNRLLDAKRIRVEEVGAPSRRRTLIVPV